jgi:malate synthase
VPEELEKIPAAQSAGNRFKEARQLFEQVALAEPFTEFLTLPAYEHID